jgi:hypothetical protein
MTTPDAKPCAACREQVTKGRHDRPHAALLAIDTREARGSMFGGWEETTYRCQTCSAVIEHTNDRNEVAPFWWFSKESPGF